MSRQFPRFLFSDPKNTKTTGPFVVHNLFPKAILKVYRLGEEFTAAKKLREVQGRFWEQPSSKIALEILECETESIHERHEIADAVFKWLQFNEEIKF